MSAADNIKRLRKARGWTQVRLSMEAHVSQQAISFIESGRNEPSIEMIRALAGALGVTSSEIIGDVKSADSFGVNQDEIKLLDIFNQLNDSGRAFLVQQAETVLQQPAFRKDGFVSSVG